MYSFYPNPTFPNVFPTQMNVGATQPTQIQYVNNKQSAETFQMPTSSSIILMDSNLPRFYMKQTDASGVATIKAYDFKEVEEEKPVEYVTKAEFDKFKASVNGKGAKHEPANDARKQQ